MRGGDEVLGRPPARDVDELELGVRRDRAIS